MNRYFENMPIADFFKIIAKDNGIYEPEAQAMVADCSEWIEKMMNNNKLSPDEYFNLIGSGSYKEVYDLPYGKGFVIKFVTQQNHTRRELRIMRLAEQEGLDGIFMPTYTYLLPNKITSTIISEEEGLPISFNYIMIQPRIAFTNGESGEFIDFKSPTFWLDNGYKVYTADLKRLDLPGLAWLLSVRKHYGDDYTQTFLEFCYWREITDLHSENIGWYETPNGALVPTIIDWISA